MAVAEEAAVVSSVPDYRATAALVLRALWW